MHRHVIIGPPGTGKTTYLKDRVEEFLKAGKCTPKEIGYFSFTVRAAEEIRDRIVKDSNLKCTKETVKILYPYFSTLHSLAYLPLSFTSCFHIPFEGVGHIRSGCFT